MLKSTFLRTPEKREVESCKGTERGTGNLLQSSWEVTSIETFEKYANKEHGWGKKGGRYV